MKPNVCSYGRDYLLITLGGAITAALILQEFVGDTPWAHLDIGGPAFAESDSAICPKAGTGFGVRTLLKCLSTLQGGISHG